MFLEADLGMRVDAMAQIYELLADASQTFPYRFLMIHTAPLPIEVEVVHVRRNYITLADASASPQLIAKRPCISRRRARLAAPMIRH
jgi:hypothetical protein